MQDVDLQALKHKPALRLCQSNQLVYTIRNQTDDCVWDVTDRAGVDSVYRHLRNTLDNV